MTVIRNESELREVYREPSKPALDKEIGVLDEHCRTLIAAAPFFIIASSNAQGHSDASPKGGPPGFVRVLDEHRLAWGDLAGNNRIDTFRNVVENPHVGLIFLVPGMDETLRVTGTATITTDPAVLEATALDGVPAPRVAVVVEVDSALLHCAKAFRRAGLWEPDTWPDRADLPTAGCIYRDHMSIEVDAKTIDDVLEDGYTKSTWDVGGAGA